MSKTNAKMSSLKNTESSQSHVMHMFAKLAYVKKQKTVSANKVHWEEYVNITIL